jgi:hypothetical protein
MGVAVVKILAFCDAVAAQCQKNGQSLDPQDCVKRLPLLSSLEGSVGRYGYHLELLPVRGAVKIFSEFRWNGAKMATARALSDFCDKFQPPPAPVTEPKCAPAEEAEFTPSPQFTSVRNLTLAPAEDIAMEPPADEAKPPYSSEAEKDEAYHKAVRRLLPSPNLWGPLFSPSDSLVAASAAALGSLIWFANEAWNVTESPVLAELNMMAISIGPLRQYIIDESNKFGTR